VEEVKDEIKSCPTCGKEVEGTKKFCDRKCYLESLKK